jgi:prepilin-type processing-associated H-X9-DG protein
MDAGTTEAGGDSSAGAMRHGARGFITCPNNNWMKGEGVFVTRRHNGGANALMLDGHVTFFEVARFSDFYAATGTWVGANYRNDMIFSWFDQ